MLRGRPERELAAWWEAEAVAAAKAHAAKEQVRVDPGAAGEPEGKAGEEQPKEPTPAQPRAAEEGDARAPPRPPSTLPMYQAKPVSAQGLYPHGKSRSKNRSCKRSSDRSEEYCSPRPVTVDSSKARTSLDALKISIRQLKWKEFPFGRRLPCDIYWHGVSFHDSDIFSGLVNKFPGMTEMVRKITLSRAVRIMQNLFPEEYNFYPRSWILPDEFQLFVAQILGFDILLMKNLKPILLEVNANPSMRIEHEQELSPGVFENVPSLVDEEVKVAVIRDTLRLMDPFKKKRESQSQQLGKPLASKEEPSESDLASASAGSAHPEAHLPSICLKQVFPKYAKQFNHLRLVDRMANLFIRFLGIKGTMKLGPTGFRTFIRNCKLSSSSLSMAAVDILYIDITRRWNSMTVDQRDSGSFFGLMAGQLQDLQACGVQPNCCWPGSRGSRGNSCERRDVGSSTLPFVEEASFELLQHHSGPTERLLQTGTLRLGGPWRAKQDSLPVETTVQEGICRPGWHACPFLHTGCARTPSHWGQGSGSSSPSPSSDRRRHSEHLLNFRLHGFGDIDANS
ncbi:tubulin polyglutamylase TTLL11 isoform X8 [Orcinus orca]|uniref:tubulin polyglutamylase TTLL11 isoform X8 n=1 Tax=Orcinus orca TaxID=9733 RepID=UPI0014416B24|nr:tubulin polyglutamylase TTLL11 isoform X8 [Orcinus orca]